MYSKYIKRLLDIVISILVIIVCLPLYLLVSLGILIFDGGDIFYNQYRTGVNGVNFKMYKFKTMKNKKVTLFGKILRKVSLDELPQFFNVLKGDMSLIGPRPWIPEYYKRFNDEQKMRVSVRPGIIGLAQINGRNNISIFNKIEHDLYYVNNLSFFLDLSIVVNSIKSVINCDEDECIEEHLNMELQMLENE